MRTAKGFQSVSRKQCFVGSSVSPEDYDSVIALARQLQVSVSRLVRMGLAEVARLSGAQAIAVDKQKAYDRSSPESGRAWRDREALYARRLNGERTSDLAREYGVTPNALGSYFNEIERQTGVRRHLAIQGVVQEAVQRVLDDPFQSLPSRTREIAEEMLRHATYEETAVACGVSRQRVHQVAVMMKRLANEPDGRRKRFPYHTAQSDTARPVMNEPAR